MSASTTLRRAAAVLLAATGALHLALAGEFLEELTWLGILFLIGGTAAALVAVVLWLRDHPAAWTAGALLAGGMAVGYVLSLTVGLFGFREGELELSGVVSLGLEGGYLALWAVAATSSVRARAATSH